MEDKKLVKTKRRINPAIYGILTGLLFIGVGFGWLHVSNLLNSINGFGLGSIVKVFPILGVGVIALGLVLLVLSFYQASTRQLVVKEAVVQTKKNKEIQDIEVSSFEKKHIKGLVFDLDGTLLDTIDDLKDSGNYVLEKRGYPTKTRLEYEKALGNGIYKLVERILPKEINPGKIQEIYEEFLEVYGQRYMMKTKPYDGIIDMLKEFVKRGYLLAIVTNKRDEFAFNLVKRHFGDIVFVDVVGESPNNPKKPDASLLKLIATEMMISTNQLAMIGDSEVDIQTAKNANAVSIAVNWGFREEEFLIQAQPDFLISSPAEAVMLLDEINTKDEFVLNKDEEVETI